MIWHDDNTKCAGTQCAWINDPGHRSRRIGDRVRWVDGTETHAESNVPAGCGTIQERDPDDLLYTWYVESDDGKTQAWFRGKDLLPEATIQPPKFASIEEADAWLEAHS